MLTKGNILERHDETVEHQIRGLNFGGPRLYDLCDLYDALPAQAVRRIVRSAQSGISWQIPVNASLYVVEFLISRRAF